MHPPSLLCALSLIGAIAAQAPQLTPEVLGRPTVGCVAAVGSSSQARLFGGQAWVGGVVPFTLHPTVSPAMAVSLQSAMLEITTRTRVRFVLRTTEPDYVLVRDATINSSPIGRQGGLQVLYLANWNATFEVVHALMHVLGFWHEHQRPDRDTFVQIQAANVDPARAVEFAVVPLGSTYNLPYDFGSVMHFGATEASSNGSPTMIVLPPNQSQQASIGQRLQLSPGDVEVLRRTYGSLVPPLIVSATPSSVTSYRASAITLTGERFDEASRVLFRGAAASYQVLSPTQLRVTLPLLPAIGPAPISVESGAGLSQPVVVQVTGLDPPQLEGPPVLNSQFSIPFRVYSSNGRQILLLAAFNNSPSIASGIVSLGIGNNFSAYGEVATGIADASGQWLTNLTGPSGLPSGTSIWLQAVSFDLANFTLPLAVTNVLPVRAF
jgi:hypothetical protein